MKRLRQLLSDQAEDRGAALILVLFVVTVIGLAGAALLTFSDASIRTTVALREQAGNAYNANGAAQVAINSLSRGYGFTSPALFKNANSTTCFGPNTTSGTLNLPGFYPATSGIGTTAGSASVVCTADPASGVNATVVPITAANRPGQAIMTLGQTGEDGLNIKALSGEPLSVKGIVRSNSSINVDSGTLQSTAAVTAFGACSGTIVSIPAKNCNTSTSLTDPSYKSEPEWINPVAPPVPTYQAIPATCPGGVMTFQPGYYDDAVSLSDLMTGNGTCGGSTWWFRPGTYYFDFHNNTDDPDVYRGSGTGNSSKANQWAITRGHLVAGTPADSNGNAIASPGSSPKTPGACQNPIKSVGALGVQFIFGGDSQLALGGSADAEICGTYSADRPPIGVFGLKSGTATTTTLTGTGTGAGSSLKMSTVPAQTTSFVTPTNIIQQDNVSSVWAKTTATLETSTITVSGYAPPSPIPAGSIVKSATVRVRHGNSASYVTGANKDTLVATFTPKGVTGSPPASAIPLTTTLPNSASLVTDSTDVYETGTSAFAKYVHDNGFTGADLTYAATLSHAGNENVDAIQIDISYVTPAFRSENTSAIPSNCIMESYTGTPSGGCAVLSTSAPGLPNFSGAFYIQGTTYTPRAAIDLTLNNATQQVLRFGVISRSLWIKQTGSFSYPGPVIEVPDITAGGSDDPVVFLTVYVCPATVTSTCSTSPGKITALRVKATMSGSAPPSAMRILTWSTLR